MSTAELLAVAGLAVAIASPLLGWVAWELRHLRVEVSGMWKSHAGHASRLAVLEALAGIKNSN